jgi:2-polyprenyl-6-hydroxyphenyl methylase/3-demethylubiquinone-9 3-methyltransferase
MSEQTVAEHQREVATGQRFEFGKNWAAFLRELDDDRISRAEESLKTMLKTQTLAGKTFLDIGSGSGLFSLAAKRLGAKVRSFDYDPDSVGCTQELKRRYFENDPEWTVQQGSVLDRAFLSALGKFDIVYSWGVLHHTGEMWKAIDNASTLVKPGGQFFIAIYNDQGTMSKRWKKVKQCYLSLPAPARFLVSWPTFIYLMWRPMLKDVLLLRPGASIRNYKQRRGMSLWRDIIDWVGGYPFEVAKPEQIMDFCAERGFQLMKMTTVGGSLGCNQFVFVRRA